MNSKYEKNIALTWFKRELRDLHKMSITGIVITKNTISDEMLDELKHFLNFGQELIKDL